MAKDIKIVKSKTAPVDKNVLWDDGENLKIYRNGKWESANTTEIKESSIPLSALNDEAKRGIPYLEYNEEKQIIDIKIGVTEYKLNGIFGNYFEFKNHIIPIEYSNGFNTNLTGPSIIGKIIYIGHNERKLILDRSPIMDETITFCPNIRIYELDGAFLPNTVLKTTPQTLSDTDKNQALANLGIDPVVWKYMCNPLVLYTGKKIPNELLTNDGNLKYLYPNIYRIEPSSDDFGFSNTFHSDSSAQFIPKDVDKNYLTCKFPTYKNGQATPTEIDVTIINGVVESISIIAE